MTDNTALIEALERAEGPSRELDRSIFYALQDQMTGDPFFAPKFTASIDAAMTLVPEGWAATVCRFNSGKGKAILWRDSWCDNHAPTAGTDAPTPAIALCIAALRAGSAAK